MKRVNYFSHDCNASRDPKIERMENDLGLKGYAIFFKILEKMCENSTYFLSLDFKGLAKSLRVGVAYLTRVVRDYDLFVIDEERGVFFSKAFRERYDEQQKISNKRKSAIKKRWNDTNVLDKDTNFVSENKNINNNSIINNPIIIKENKKTTTNVVVEKENKKTTTTTEPTKENIFDKLAKEKELPPYAPTTEEYKRALDEILNDIIRKKDENGKLLFMDWCRGYNLDYNQAVESLKKFFADEVYNRTHFEKDKATFAESIKQHAFRWLKREIPKQATRQQTKTEQTNNGGNYKTI